MVLLHSLKRRCIVYICKTTWFNRFHRTSDHWNDFKSSGSHITCSTTFPPSCPTSVSWRYWTSQATLLVLSQERFSWEMNAEVTISLLALSPLLCSLHDLLKIEFGIRDLSLAILDKQQLSTLYSYLRSLRLRFEIVRKKWGFLLLKRSSVISARSFSECKLIILGDRGSGKTSVK